MYRNEPDYDPLEDARIIELQSINTFNPYKQGQDYNMSPRLNALHLWLNQTRTLHTAPYMLTALAGDASFRRYFRLFSQGHSWIVMDAPPHQEPLHDFLHISERLTSAGITTPAILEQNITDGFLLLEDFGDELLLHAATKHPSPLHYHKALDLLLQMQTVDTHHLPAFNEAFMLQELSLCLEWFLQAYLGLSLSTTDHAILTEQFQTLVERIALQPQVFIHRDFHSRNLMVCAQKPTLGVIDFQDAMRGPLGYDLSSLLKDCYLSCSATERLAYLSYFYRQHPLAQTHALSVFQEAVELCGIQRHLKILGIFCRLHLRDHKSTYLTYLPLTLDYLMSSLAQHAFLAPLYQWLQAHVQLPCGAVA